jgi:aryl-alcohol dehydrogenase-like predicted oxidoreductase
MGLGCWAIGGPSWRGDQPSGYGKIDDNESIRAIHRALDLGVNFFDTADVYGAGHSERILGRALDGCREQVVIATKFGRTFDEKSRQQNGINISPEHIHRACQASMRRLNTDYIDLYLLHIWSLTREEATPVREVLEKLKDNDVIKAYGWSTDVTENARFFAEKPNCTAVEHELNVLVDANEMLELCENFDLASINRTPLAMGLLTGKFNSSSSLPANDIRGKEPEWMKYFKGGKPNPEWLEKTRAVREILTSDERTLAQGALAWIWARSERTIPIPGFKNVKQVEENIGAMEFGPLNTDKMHAIDEILGERSPRYVHAPQK